MDIHELQAYFGDTTGSAPDHHNKASMVMKQVVILLLVEGTDFSL